MVVSPIVVLPIVVAVPIVVALPLAGLPALGAVVARVAAATGISVIPLVRVRLLVPAVAGPIPDDAQRIAGGATPIVGIARLGIAGRPALPGRRADVEQVASTPRRPGQAGRGACIDVTHGMNANLSSHRTFSETAWAIVRTVRRVIRTERFVSTRNLDGDVKRNERFG
ncbi:hypothetical protein MKK68_23630 [Methylobacterium sp. E-016]|uniref:hypothetical protein n=1 Tax=Methylobacterium sp. E-016 TaxID=2836556 RepID=UPI001FBC09E2|nr:hypothetical protein [Methylobacterium sp. E-016]MCJ2078599.1 hypothetical protein [Methylobacterium sp. E-016]